METKIAVLIAVMAISNFLLKAFPVRLLGDRKLPPFVLKWLEYVPVPLLAAMLSTDLLVREGKLALSLSNPLAVAALPTFVAAYLSKSLFVTVAIGMLTLAALRF